MKHLDKEFQKNLDLSISDLPRVKLIYLPTPLEDCLRFSQALGGPRILIKRDDNLAFFGGSKNRIQNYCDYVGKVYGEVTKESLRAIELFAQTKGNLLDPVYTGKAMTGLIDYIRNGIICQDDTVVFFHTCGTPPLLYSYNKELIHGRVKKFSPDYILI